MTNGEKYKTAEDRIEAHKEWCNHHRFKSSNGVCPYKNCMTCEFKWLDLVADEDGEIKVGDTVAYRSLDDNQPEWVAFTVRHIEGEYLYEYEDKSGENIAIACAHKVNVRK